LRTLTGISLDELVPFIDWTPFFSAFELKGHLPGDFAGRRGRSRSAEAVRRRAASTCRHHARQALRAMRSTASTRQRRRRRCRGVPRRTRTELAAKFHFLRQQIDKPQGRFDHCLADYIAPKDSGPERLPGLLASRPGHGLGARSSMRFKEKHDDYSVLHRARLWR
jgi:5-methyltetrahydrofolate--homocysteine methyltransferase